MPGSKLQCRKRCGCKKISPFPSPTPLRTFLRGLGRNQPTRPLCTTASWAQSHQPLPCLGSPQSRGICGVSSKPYICWSQRGYTGARNLPTLPALRGPAQGWKATSSFPPWVLVGSAKPLCTLCRVGDPPCSILLLQMLRQWLWAGPSGSHP